MERLIIGLGTIGSAILDDAIGISFDGIDIQNEKVSNNIASGNIVKEGDYNAPYDFIIITVKTSQSVIDVLKKVNYQNYPLICIESTLKPAYIEQIKELCNGKCKLAIFPHRFYSEDKTKRVFNLKRVCGLWNCSKKDFFALYGGNLLEENIIFTTPLMACLSKIVENSYRFIEISIAEELKMRCNDQKVDFNALRELINSKWNLSMLEAREGIWGDCLNNDMNSTLEFFNPPDISIFRTAREIDINYKEFIDKHDKDNQSEV